MKSSHEQVGHYQTFQIMAEILSAAFGGKKDKFAGKNILQPKNKAEAKSMLALVLGRG